MKFKVPSQIGLAILGTALLLVLAFPLGEQGYLGWFAFVPLLHILRGRGFLVAVVTCLATIFLASQLSIWGVFYSFRDPAGDPGWVRTGFFIFGLAVCVPVGIWGDRGSAKLRPWWFACIAVLMEAFLMVQLPVHLALSQYRNFFALQVASLGGVWLLSFLMWWSNFYLAEQSWRKVLSAAALLTPIWLLTSLFHFQLGGPHARFGVVQIAEPEEATLLKLHRMASEGSPEFVVWPEFAGIPWTSAGDPHLLAALSTRKGNSPIITSYPDASKPLPYNVAALFSDGRSSDLYRKRRLFGGEANMHLPGSKAVAVPYGLGGVGLNICFDSCYPEIVRDTARLPEVNVIAVPSIDPYGTNNFVSAVHASYTPIRAAEEGVSIVRCDGHAFSQFVDPYGQVVADLLPGDRAAFVSLPVTPHWTPYKRFGDWFLYLVALASSLGFISHLIHLRKERTRAPQG